MTLEPGQAVRRKVIAAHWPANSVTTQDSFAFWARAEQGGLLRFFVEAGGRKKSVKIVINSSEWKRYRVSFESLRLEAGDIGAIQAVGFSNRTKKRKVILLDDFLIRKFRKRVN